MASSWPTNISDYINGHLSRLTIGGGGGSGPFTWGLHIDTVVMSLILAIIPVFYMYTVARTASVSAPNKRQVFFELVIEFFDKQVRDLFPNAPPIVGPMAVTIFIWVLLMNTMDILPVDIVTASSYILTGSVWHFKILPTADLSLTAAMALCVFLMVMYYNLKVKGVGGFVHEVMSAPFGIKAMPFNVLLRIVEELAKPLSLSMRLFGNLFAAEMIFLLIAGLGIAGLAYADGFLTGMVSALSLIAQAVLGGVWAVYHILVIPLQAFIFAMLTTVYLAMAHDTH